MVKQSLSLIVNRRQLVRLVERVAARCHSQVWERVKRRVVEMSPDQARGYIRTRSAQVVDREVSLVASVAAVLVNQHHAAIHSAVQQRVVSHALVEAMRLQLEQQTRARRAA